MSTLVADTASTTTTYTDATATEAGETYAYQVKAIRGEERSQASGQAQVQVPHDAVDLAPTGLTALILTASVVGEEDSATQVGLTWTAPAEDADTITGYGDTAGRGPGRVHHPGGRHREHGQLLRRRYSNAIGDKLYL